MVYNIISICSYLFELFIVFLVYTQLFFIKKSHAKTILIGLGLFLTGFLCFVFIGNAYLNTAMYLIICIAFANLCFDVKIKSSVIISVIMTALMTVTEFISMCLVSGILHIDIAKYASSNLFYILFISLSKIIYLLLSIIIVSLSKLMKIGKSKTGKTPIYTFIYPLCSLFTIFVYWIISINYEISDKNEMLMIISVGFSLLAIIATYVFYIYTSKQDNELMNLRMSMEKIRIEEEYYKLLDYQSGELKRLVHDEKNHLIVIKNMTKEDEVKDYIDEIYSDLKNQSFGTATNNKFLDCIINKYKIQCNSSNIDFSVNIRTSNLSFMQNSDVTSLISNLLDNSLRAAGN